MEAFREARWLHAYHSVQQINESSKLDIGLFVFLDKIILWLFGFLESCFDLKEFYREMEMTIISDLWFKNCSLKKESDRNVDQTFSSVKGLKVFKAIHV